jgi:HD-GYP domain-containing protein (c-di-GMP phosphodiesterase class II)
VAALVHDAGLLRVPLRVVQKESPLGRKDEALRRRHAEWTEDMVRASAPGKGWLHRIVRQVHERTSGRGYPDGLTGDRIDPAAKILGLADALEARTHPRPGRPAQSPFDAIRSLSREHGDDFDRGVFRALLRSVSLFPVGSRVALSNGSTARVASINPDNFYRPEVEIVLDAAGEPVPPGHVMDLAESPFLHITGPVRERDPAGAGESR